MREAALPGLRTWKRTWSSSRRLWRHLAGRWEELRRDRTAPVDLMGIEAIHREAKARHMQGLSR